MRAMSAVVVSIALAVMSWGSYIPVLHKGQTAMDGSRLRPFICVGLAYCLIAVVVPLAMLVARGEKGFWSRKGLIYSLAGGAFGAVGALGVIMAQNAGGKPLFVIPLIFGCAPVVNTLFTMIVNRSYREVGPAFLAGLILVVSGAVTVLIFKPVQGQEAGAQGFLAAVTSSLQVLMWVACTALCWGIYGPILHKGQAAMAGSRLRPFICVGVAYMVIAVLIPFALLESETQGRWDWPQGISYSLAAGAAGALGALGIIMAFNFGGKPVYVMPLVFGGAPVVGTIISMAIAGDVTPSPYFYAGLIAVAAGAVTVLVFAPKPHAHPAAPQRAAAVAAGR